jgi:MFS family permease
MKASSVLKSLLAVVAGFLTVVVLSVVTDMVVEALGIFPGADHPQDYRQWMLALALFYRTVITVFGGYLTAKLAPQNPMKHAVILGVLGTLAGAAGAIAAWSLGNHWYPIALAVLAIPSTWLGGKLFQR